MTESNKVIKGYVCMCSSIKEMVASNVQCNQIDTLFSPNRIAVEWYEN